MYVNYASKNTRLIIQHQMEIEGAWVRISFFDLKIECNDLRVPMNMYFTDCESCTPGPDNTPICSACLNGFVYEDEFGAK